MTLEVALDIHEESKYVFSDRWEARRDAYDAKIARTLHTIDSLISDELRGILERRICGKPTKKGTPCKQQAQGWSGGFAGGSCKTHRDDNSKVFEALLDLAYELGELKATEREQDVCSRKHVDTPEPKKVPKPTRTHDGAGNQLVGVDGLTYHWRHPHDPLVVGDLVELPHPPWAYSSWTYPTGMVTTLETSYTGDTVAVRRKLSI